MSFKLQGRGSALTLGVLIVLMGCACTSRQLDPPTPFAVYMQPSSCDSSVERFSQLLKFDTVSDPKEALHVRHPQEFQELDSFLRKSYPCVFSNLTVHKVGAGNLSFLIEWPGTMPELAPALFVSHIDPVPVTPGTEKDWRYPPFSGAIAEGFVWGRGAQDVKIGVAGLMEAASELLEAGFEPDRTVLFAFGQDEEVGGDYGAGCCTSIGIDESRCHFGCWNLWSNGVVSPSTMGGQN